MGEHRTPDAVALDLTAVVDWLADRGLAPSGALTASRIGRGHSNLTYLLSDEAGAQWIARRPPQGQLLQSAHDVAREARVMTALANTPVPTPAIYGTIASGMASDVPVVLMERVEGSVVDTMDAALQLPLPVRHELGVGLAGALAAIHAVDVDEVGLADLAKRSAYAQRQLSRWSRQWEQSNTRDLPALDELTAGLQQRIPVEREVSLVHGDLHIRNVIAEPTTGAVAAVLDWELCTLGDPLADLGSSLAYWPQEGDRPVGLFAASRLPGFITRDELVERYVRATGRDVDDLGFWHVLGLWKIAIIAEGAYRRSLNEPANATDGEPITAEIIETIVDLAHDVARGYGWS